MPQDEQSKLHQFFKSPDEKFVAPPQETSVEEEPLPEDMKNRHIRRLEAKLQSEREAAIAREARLQALSETQKFRESANADEYEQMVARIYGTDTPEKAAATEMLQKAIKGYADRAKQEAIETLREEFRSQQAEEAQEEQTVNSYIEQIEDEYGVDLTSTASARERQEKFRDLWFKLSPKDANGDVIEYADPREVYEIFSQNSGSSQAQQLAARSMTRSAPVESRNVLSPTEKMLKEHGILDPFF